MQSSHQLPKRMSWADVGHLADQRTTKAVIRVGPRTMASERRIRILTRLAAHGAPELETRRLCEVCAEVTGMTGAGIMLMSGELPRGSVYTTNKVSALVEQLQYPLGEGPR